MRNFFIIFLGGGFGSAMRYLLSNQVDSKFSISFPFGIFIVNMIGCFLIGLFLAYLGKNQLLASEWKFLLATGFCGGFTTFSTFSSDNLNLLQSGNLSSLLLNMIGSVILGLLAVYLGQMLGK